LTISSYIIDNITIRPVNLISEAVSIRDEMKKMSEEYLWIYANEIEDIFPLQGIFGLHPLTVEAVLHHNQPSKIEEYTRYIFAIIDGIAENQEKKIEESGNTNDKKISSMMVLEDDLYMFLEHRWIITLNIYNKHFEENIKKKVKGTIQQTKSLMPNLSSFAMHKEGLDNSSMKKNILKKNELVFRLALEEMILSYFPIIDNISKQLEQTEEDILDENSSSSKNNKIQLSKILFLRKKISFIERTLGMMSRAVQDFVNRYNNNNEISEHYSVSDTLPINRDKQSITTSLLNSDSIIQMRSLNDRIMYLRNDIENMHQRIISLRETYNSSLSANLNETIRTLTVIATIVLPLTLITGIYGMNFKVMPELTSEYGYYYALGLIGALGGVMILYFKRKRWI
jgi:magnesium transporter